MLDGETFEERAAELLQARGLQIIERRYRCRLGEIDLIATDDHRLIFVEVRARRHARYGGAAASVDRRKQCKLARCAAHFLRCQPQWRNLPCRFDVVAWQAAADGSIKARWLKAAFSP